MYKKYIKRLLDISASAIALLLLFPILLLLLFVGAIVMKGNPIFMQPRPGKKDKNGTEKIFYLFKLRTMSNVKGADGKLLPDHQRLNRYGKWLRSTSLDEIPSLINILLGDLSLVGPRPQLVRDMTFMTEEQRRRHDVMPGLTGLAQINGRNNISWEQKFIYDLQYIDQGITLRNDLKILWKTVDKVLRKSDIVREGTSSDLDFGDWLMQEGKVSREEYDRNQAKARELLKA